MSKVFKPIQQTPYYHKGRPNNYTKDYWFLDEDDSDKSILMDELTRKEACRPEWKLMLDTDETPMASGFLLNQQEIKWMLRYHTLCVGSILQKIRNGDGYWICIEKKLMRKDESIYRLRRLTDAEARRYGL